VSQQQLLAKLVSSLEKAHVSYVLTGSVVSSFYGEPRATHDIDVVVQVSLEQLAAIAADFPAAEYAFDDVAATQAITRRDMFQLMNFASGDKVDFWPLTSDPFNQQSFARRRRDRILGIDAFIPTPEDMILQKLRWAHDYESEKQFRDALGVYELQFARLDKAYIVEWVKQLGIDETWQRLLAQAQPLEE
jgi:hypothetical protein